MENAKYERIMYTVMCIIVVTLGICFIMVILANPSPIHEIDVNFNIEDGVNLESDGQRSDYEDKQQAVKNILPDQYEVETMKDGKTITSLHKVTDYDQGSWLYPPLQELQTQQQLPSTATQPEGQLGNQIPRHKQLPIYQVLTTSTRLSSSLKTPTLIQQRLQGNKSTKRKQASQHKVLQTPRSSSSLFNTPTKTPLQNINNIMATPIHTVHGVLPLQKVVTDTGHVQGSWLHLPLQVSQTQQQLPSTTTELEEQLGNQTPRHKQLTQHQVLATPTSLSSSLNTPILKHLRLQGNKSNPTKQASQHKVLATPRSSSSSLNTATMTPLQNLNNIMGTSFHKATPQPVVHGVLSLKKDTAITTN